MKILRLMFPAKRITIGKIDFILLLVVYCIILVVFYYKYHDLILKLKTEKDKKNLKSSYLFVDMKKSNIV